MKFNYELDDSVCGTMAETMLSGSLWNGDDFEEGTVILEDGIVREVEFGRTEKGADFAGYIMPGVTDTHTHVADAGLRLDRRYGLEELVAPPNGLKHRYLRDTPKEKLIADMKGYVGRLVAGGVSRFYDFREGGVEGARMLRSVSDRAVVLGRPESKEFDINEIEDLLKVADGVGLPSITDMDHQYIEAIADVVHRKRKIFALHVSERIREDFEYVLSLEPNLVVHMVRATDADMKRCADAGTLVSVCPSSNLYFGAEPPVARMLRAGMNITLGTDNGMLFPSADIFAELGLLGSLSGSALKGTPAQLVAYVTKLLYDKSSLTAQTGKRADIVAMPYGKFPASVGKGAVRYGP